MPKTSFYLCWGLVALTLSGCGQVSGDPPGQIMYPFVLTQEEIALSRDLAEMDMPAHELSSTGKTIFVKVDLLPDCQAETAQRLVMVQHYRYQDDETIFTMIDLRAREILKRELTAHFPTALAPVEVERALHLARSDGRIRPLLDAIPTKFDVRPIEFASPHEPLFGHRVAHVLLRQEGDYLVNPRVLVDLTTETVHLETNKANP